MNLTRICAVSAFALTILGFSGRAQIPNPGSEGKIQLEWMKDYPSALRKAEIEKKALLIDITTDWCGWSKKMDRETFADIAVQKELRAFVLIRLNPEASDKNAKVAEGFGADGFPTLVVANYRGEELGSSSGYMAPKEMLTFLKRYEPLFKGNALGYRSVQLDPGDPLMKAIARIPAPASRPTSVGSFVVLDQSTLQLQSNGVAKIVARTATYINDRDKGGLPQAEIRYVSSRQKASFKSVRILDVSGKGRDVDLKLAKDEHAYSNQNVYWDVRTLTVSLPELKDGQILDVIQELEWQPIMTNKFWFRWNTGLQMLLTSDLTITFPQSLHLQRKAVRCPTPVTETRNPDGTTTWRLITSNTKPMEPVLFMPPLYELWEGYDFYTPCTQDDVAQWFGNLSQGLDVLPGTAKQRLLALKRSSTNQTALLQGIMDWVTKDIRYVSVAFGVSSHRPHAVTETLSNLYGDCKDQSLLVRSLCREAGIPASLVLVGAMGEPVNAENPAVERFDHCIVEAVADGKTYYVDPAAGPSKLGYVPPSYAGTSALKLDGAKGQVVTLPPYQPRPNQSRTETLVRLNPNGSGTVTELASFNGAAATLLKEKMKGTQPEKVRKGLEEMYKRSGRKVLDFFMTDPNSPGSTYETRITYEVGRFGAMTAGGLAFDLGGHGKRDDSLEALNLPRARPFWFRTADPAQVVYTVELPAGAVLKTRPADLELQTPFLKASRKVVANGNKLSVTESSQMLEARLAPSEAAKVYDAFRKLEDHRDYMFMVKMPVLESSASAAGAVSIVRQTPGVGTAVGNIKLNGISGVPPKALAIINGKTLAVGESATIKIDSKPVTIQCQAIGTTSATVRIEGVDAPQELHLQ